VRGRVHFRTGPLINLAFLQLLRKTHSMAATTYLDRFLEPMTEALTPEFARVIADLRDGSDVAT